MAKLIMCEVCGKTRNEDDNEIKSYHVGEWGLHVCDFCHDKLMTMPVSVWESINWYKYGSFDVALKIAISNI